MIFKNINKTFADQKIINDFSFEIPKSSIVCLIGPSGCGKSTLLNIIAGLLDADSGSIELEGKISYLFQEPRLLDWKTALENISLASGVDIDKARFFLKKVGLENDLEKKPKQMSGGMKQRVAIARAFAYKSDVILLDEPFQNLDIELKSNLLKIFLEMWNEDRRTVLWVTHDVSEAALVADKVICVGKNGWNNISSISCNIPQNERNIKNTADFQLEIFKTISSL